MQQAGKRHCISVCYNLQQEMMSELGSVLHGHGCSTLCYNKRNKTHTTNKGGGEKLYWLSFFLSMLCACILIYNMHKHKDTCICTQAYAHICTCAQEGMHTQREICIQTFEPVGTKVFAYISCHEGFFDPYEYCILDFDTNFMTLIFIQDYKSAKSECLRSSSYLVFMTFG